MNDDERETGSIADEDLDRESFGEGEAGEASEESESSGDFGSIADDDSSEGGDAQTSQVGGEDAGKAEGQAGKEAQEDWALTVDEKEFPMPEENLKSFSAACKKAGLTKAQAEAVLGWHKGQWAETQKWDAQMKEQTYAGWQKEILEDKEFGGANYKRTIADARKFLRAFDPKGAVRELLRQTGGDRHPEIIRIVARAGSAMSEHAFVTEGAKGGEIQKPLWERMYGSDGK